MKNLITIIPPKAKPGFPAATMGTKVLGPDGVAIGGITRIELIGEVNDVWRARIDCVVNAPEINGVAATIRSGTPLRWWQRALVRLAGIRAVETTPLDEYHHAHWSAV